MERLRHGSNVLGSQWFGGLTAAFLLAVILSACGGGGSSHPATSTTGDPTTITVTGTVSSSDISGAGSLRGSSIRPLVVVRRYRIWAIRFGSPTPVDTKVEVAEGASYSVELEKGFDYILQFREIGGDSQLAAVVENLHPGIQAPADLESTLVALNLMSHVNEPGVTGLEAVQNAVDNAVNNGGLSLTLANFTEGDPASFFSSVTNGIPVLDTTNTDIELLAEQIVNTLDTLPAPPGPVTGFSCNSYTTATINLGWTAVPYAKGYRVYYSNTLADLYSGDYLNLDNTYTEYPLTRPSLTDNTYLSIKAFNDGGSGEFSSPVMVLPHPVSIPDNAVTGLSAVPGAAKVDLVWDVKAGATRYDVAYSDNAAFPAAGTTTLSVDNTAHGKAVTGLTNGRGYYFKVRAIFSTGAGAYSIVVSATPDYVPPVPDALAEGKKMIQSLRDTAQTLVGYQRSDNTIFTGQGWIDCAVISAKDDMELNVVPALKGTAERIPALLESVGAAIDNSPAGGTFEYREEWDSYSSSYVRRLYLIDTNPADPSWPWLVKDMVNGVDYKARKTVGSLDGPAGLGLVPFEFDGTSSVDNTLRYTGKMNISAVHAATSIPTGVTITANFKDNTVGTDNGLTVNGSLSATIGASDNVISALSLGGSLLHRKGGVTLLSGAGTFSIAASAAIHKLEAGDLVSARLTRVSFTGGELATVAAKLTGSLVIDLQTSRLVEEEYSGTFVNRSYPYSNSSSAIVYWDTGAARSDVRSGWTLAGIEVNGSDNAAPMTLAGLDNVSLEPDWWGYNRSISIVPSSDWSSLGGSYGYDSYGPDGRQDFDYTATRDSRLRYLFPTKVAFAGAYENKLAGKALKAMTGTITATFLNGGDANADPFYLDQKNIPYSVAANNFPRVNVLFTGEVTSNEADRPRVYATLDLTSSLVNRSTDANTPEAGYEYAKVAGTVTYTDWDQTINGSMAQYMRKTVGTNELNPERFTLALTNTKVDFDLQVDWDLITGKSTFRNGTFSGNGSVVGTVRLVSGVPVVYWSDGYFESLP